MVLKYLFAFILALILHFSLYFYLSNKNIIQDIKAVKTNKAKTTNIRYAKLKSVAKVKSKPIKKHLKKTPKKLKKQVPKVIKKEVFKKLIKKPIVKKHIVKKIPINNNKAKNNLIKSYSKTKKPLVKQKDLKQTIKKSYTKKQKTYDRQTKKFLDLYGNEFNSLPKDTKLFLIKHIKDIGAITQRYLEYPYLSVQAGQSGINVIEFILNPNGTINNLKITKSSKYFLLDDNTIETIKEAYKDYPTPNKPTLIKIFVKYELN